MDGGTWWALVHGVTKSRTRLSKRLNFNFLKMAHWISTGALELDTWVVHQLHILSVDNYLKSYNTDLSKSQASFFCNMKVLIVSSLDFHVSTLSHFSSIGLFVTPRTVAHQAPL